MEKENKQRLIDAKPIVQFIMDGLNNTDKMKAFGYDAIEILAEIEYASTVDAVEVVRCKECEFSYEGLVNLMCGRCGQTKGDLRLGGVSVPEDHFCGYGKRRDGK